MVAVVAVVELVPELALAPGHLAVDQVEVPAVPVLARVVAQAGQVVTVAAAVAVPAAHQAALAAGQVAAVAVPAP